MIEAELLRGLKSIRHGFFTRQGGVSAGIYRSLNCGQGSGDDPVCVRRNRAIVAGRLGIAPERLITLWQVHSTRVITASAPWDAATRPQADAIVTNEPGLAVAVLAADCAPVLFADAGGGVVGAAHAGWRGARDGIVEAAVAAMERLGARRAAIKAVVGPAIGLAAYEVGEDFRQEFLRLDAGYARFFHQEGGHQEGGHQEGGRERPCFDLPAFLAERLEAAGVGQIEQLGGCTYQNESLFFSYRRSRRRNEPDYGRQISAILVS